MLTTVSSRRQLHLNIFLAGTGHHESSWRHPRADPGAAGTLKHYVALAQLAERGRFDSVFLADGVAAFPDIRHTAARGFEPITLLSALAGATTHIGLIGTVSTTFTEPYNLARYFSSLDHLSGGRAGWNIVTTAGDDAARNFNRDANQEHDERYARAAEFLDVVGKLWDSWQDDVEIVDRESGVYSDPTKVHEINHVGRFFRVRGPLNLPRSPQAYPLLVQAGSSATGQAFAARHAEAVFTAQQTLEDAQTFYRGLKSLVASNGRDPDHLKVLPGIVPVLGSTEAQARALDRELDELIVPQRALAGLKLRLGIDFTGRPLDEPLPPLPPVEQFNGQKSRYQLIKDLTEREKLTLRQLLSRLGGGRGHHTFVGTPEQTADHLQRWFEAGAADGFNVMPPILPDGLELFVDQVVPILRRRGLFRDEYTGQTLREHYGLPRPQNQFAREAAPVRA
jgi:FMN-dependent oxidoreductase (nitrilotriacetate monooxygenase family)